ncbi:MAG TPA: deoxyribonuclease V [Candidatus Paceibacterota bacterium]|nr:deoxyribonuclease V [Candidatus Paceibacterota bacterium]
MTGLTVTPTEAIEIQKRLQPQVLLTPLPTPPKLIGGCDVSMDRFSTEGFAGFVSMWYPDLDLCDHAVTKETIPFPYIPGLLSFREIPMLLSAWELLTQKPDVLIVDGVGIAHPRRLGIASHLGLTLDIPTIGCSKKVLTGIYEDPADEPGASAPLRDPRTSETIGAALRTKRGVLPVFVSPGHKITLEESVSIVFSCVRKHRLPEPTRLAHNVVNDYRLRDNAKANV